MGILDDLFDWISEIFEKIRSELSRFIDKLKEFLPYLIIIGAIFMGFGVIGFMGLSGWWAAGALMGAGYLLLPDEMSAAVQEVVGAAADFVSDVVEAAAPALAAIGDAVGSTIGSFLSGLGLPGLLLLGGAVWFFFLRDKEPDNNQGVLPPGGSSNGEI